MTHKPVFWIGFSVISILCAVFAFRFFPRAFPIVSLNITMDRAAAVTRAADLARQHGWGPQQGVRAAASFELDDKVQTFVELEGGGSAAFNRMLNDRDYTPYTWRVRRFRPGDVNETNIRFRPDGRPFGFVEKIAEDAQLPNLSVAAARKLGARTAADDWGIDLSDYDLVESGRQQRPNGRIDHSFVYQRRDHSLGEGSYRLQITVSGNRVSEVMPFVRVPEAFSRRYEKMRSANTAIATGGSVGMIFYLLGGCGIGLFYLLRRQALLWRPAVKLALVIAVIQILAAVNAWPLSWLHYDTAIPAGRFMLQSLLPVIFSNLLLAVVMAFSFLAAEGLSRLAFPRHPQFWQLWSRKGAASVEVAGRTAGGYLAAPVMLTYLMLFYYIAGRSWGWWNPSDALANPDSLAHYAPWFTPFATALRAGVWEESLFRAVPLAAAALIGQRYGRRGLGIGIGLVLEALVFGSAHASYPTQPAYARPVELIIPSLVFGLLYLRFGLLPSIILHFTYDNVLMSLPIFASNGAGVRLDQILVVLLLLIPALVIGVRRWQARRWLVLPEALRNAAWQPPPVTAVSPATPQAAGRLPGGWPRWLIPTLGLVCLIVLPAALLLQVRSQPQIPVLRVTRDEAAQIARQALVRRGVKLPSGTRLLITVIDTPGMQDRFVWETAGRKVYEKLVGNWIHPPRYLVRFARFNGDVVQRADEWRVTVTGKGKVRTVQHVVAESAAGATLTREQARKLAYKGLASELHVQPSSVREVSVEPVKQPARTDWTFIFADVTAQPLPRGERRIRVDIAGNQVLDAVKLIHMPQDWLRSERAATVSMNALAIGRNVLILCVLIAGAIAAIVAWSRRRFSVHYFLATAGAVLIAGSMLIANNIWPTAGAGFSTAQSFGMQAALLLIISGTLLVAAAIGAGLIMGMVAPWRQARTGIDSGRLLLAGVLLGIAFHSLSVFTVAPFHTALPAWPVITPAVSAIPVLGQLSMSVRVFFTSTIIMLLVFGVVDRYTAGWSRKQERAIFLLLLLGSIVYGSTAGGSFALWCLSAGGTGCLFAGAYWLLVRHDLAVVPVVTATYTLLHLLPMGIAAYPGATSGKILAMAVIAVLGWLLFRVMRQVKSVN